MTLNLKEAFRIQRRISELLTAYSSICSVVRRDNYITTQVIHHKSEVNNLIEQTTNFVDETKTPPVNTANQIEAEAALKTIETLLSLKRDLSQKIEEAKATISIGGLPYDTAIMMANVYRNIVNLVIGDKFADDSTTVTENTNFINVVTKDSGSISLPYTVETVVTPDTVAFEKYNNCKLDYYNRAMELSSSIEAAAFNTKIELSQYEENMVKIINRYNTFKDVAKAINC